MTKALTSKAVAARLSMRERVPLFSVVSNTDWRRAGITGETVTEMVVKHLIMRDAIGHLAITNCGAVLWATLPQ